MWTQSSSYGHGALVFPISAYLVWRLRDTLAVQDIQPRPLAIVAVAGLVALWWVSSAVSAQVGEHVAVVLLIPAVVAACLGAAVLRSALFPLLFLLAAVPAGDALVPFLMDVTADVAAGLLRAIGVPVYRDGQFLWLPGGQFEVADVCSGLRSLIAGTVIATLFAYLSYRSLWKGAVFVIATAMILIVVNGVRAFIVMWVASATDLRVLAGRDHVYFGWVLFALAMSALLWFSLRFADRQPQVVDAERPPSSTGRSAAHTPLIILLGVGMLALTALPLRRDISAAWWVLPAVIVLVWALSSKDLLPSSRSAGVPRHTAWNVRGALALTGTFALLLSGPLLMKHVTGAVSESYTISLPVVDGCERAASWAGAWQPTWTQADFNATASYRCDDNHVDVAVASYHDSSQGKDLVAVDNRLYPEDWRRYLRRSTHQVDETIAVQEFRLDEGYPRSVVWSWYVIGHRAVSTPLGVKLLQVLEVLKGNGGGGRIYWLETPMEPDLEGARNRLERFARALETGHATSNEAWP
jgi:exosortase A